MLTDTWDSRNMLKDNQTCGLHMLKDNLTDSLTDGLHRNGLCGQPDGRMDRQNCLTENLTKGLTADLTD